MITEAPKQKRTDDNLLLSSKWQSLNGSTKREVRITELDFGNEEETQNYNVNDNDMSGNKLGFDHWLLEEPLDIPHYWQLWWFWKKELRQKQ